MNKLILIISFFITVCSIYGQSEEKVLLNKGIEAYKEGDFTSALDLFNDSYTANGDYSKSVFNAANAALLNDSLDIAKDLLSEYISISENKLDKSKGHYNLGNIQYNEYEKIAENPEESQKAMKVLKESIESFKKALRNNPKDTDARHNLSLAMSKVPPPNENQENQDQKDENKDQKDQENKDQQKDGEGQDQKNQQNKNGDQKEDGEKGDQQDKESEGDKGEEKKDGEKGNQPGEEKEGKEEEGDKQKGSQGKEGEEKGEKEMMGKISRMQATKDLDAMNNEEQKTLMKVNRKKGGEKKENSSSKDW